VLPISRLPRLQIEISQPGDRGDFVIRTIDLTTEKEIYENRLPETISDTQYLYTARLLEQRRPYADAMMGDSANMVDDSWKKTNRYQDIVRYGQKLYTDLFGTNNKIRNHVQRSKHLKEGVQYVLSLDRTASELWNIPWEYLHDGEGFLALRPDTKLVRSLTKSPFRKRFRELNEMARPLRVLVVIAHPKGPGIGVLDVDQEVQNIMEALAPAVKAGVVEVDILEEGSLRNIDIALADDTYHILHYTGHGAMTPNGSCLVLEDDNGAFKPAFIADLLPIIANSKSLQLVILSGCQTGQIDETHAMSGIATGLLAVVPAVVAMQFSIADQSALIFARTFFQSVGQGKSLEDAMHASRLEMNKAYPSFCDWGMPTLYVNKLDLRLVDAAQPVNRLMMAKKTESEKLPPSKIFVGRRDELRQLRAIVPNLRVNMAYVWGMWGIGKTALVSRLIERPGRKDVIESVLVIPCAETKPNNIVEMLANWLEPLFPQAAEALRNPAWKPEQRIREAAKHVRRRRLMLVFDGFDAYQKESADQSHWEIPYPLLEAFMRALASAEWSIVTVFTSRYRWSYLNERTDSFFVEVHLNELSQIEEIFLIRRLPRFAKLDPESQFKLRMGVGGHPSSYLQLESSLARDAAVKPVPEETKKRLTSWWHSKWFEATIARLSPEEQAALRGICILDMGFWAGYVQVVANVRDRQTAEVMMARWEAFSLIHFYLAEPRTDRVWYMVHPMVKSYMLHDCTPEQKLQLHKEAATLLELDLANLAKLRYEDLGKAAPSGSNTYSLARNELQVVMEYAPPDIRSIVISRALSWRHHLLEIKNFERAGDIVNDIWSSLAYRFGYVERAYELLVETTKTTKGHQQIVAGANIGEFLAMTGKTHEAMRLYENSIRELTKLNDERNLSYVLLRQSELYQNMGRADRALKCAEQSLQMAVNLKDYKTESKALRQIAMSYLARQNTTNALKYVAMAETIGRQTKDVEDILATLNTKGTILKVMKKYQGSIQCFQEVEAIARSIGNAAELGKAYSEAGEIMGLGGDFERATRCMLDAISIAETYYDLQALAVRRFRLAMIYAMQGNKIEARAMAEQALPIAKIHAPKLTGDIQSLLRKLPRH
jgi:tetratricopeptide (TPR) repeat protein/CHAT domain-containing protein